MNNFALQNFLDPTSLAYGTSTTIFVWVDFKHVLDFSYNIKEILL